MIRNEYWEITKMSDERKVVRAVALILPVLMMAALAGCISSRSDVAYGPKGPAIRSDTLRQIECGQTTKGWLLGVLGEPTRAVRTSPRTEILTYEYTKTVDSDFSFFIFFSADNRREERTVYVFELENDVVVRYWKER